VTDKALGSPFHAADEEAEYVRANPAARTAELLKKMSGK
jgi:hypothetical protein